MRSFRAGHAAPLAALALVIACASLHAAPADPDPSFGTGGVVIDPMSGNDALAHAIALDAAGRVVVAGQSVVAGASDFAVLRLDPGGVPDPAFGSGGRAFAGFGTNSLDEAYGVVALADGRVVVGGSTFLSDGSNTYPDIAALRLAAEGSVDTGFGNHGNGWATSTRVGGDNGIAMASGAGGYTIAGYVVNGGADAAVLRLDTLGMPEPLFGSAGFVVAQPDTNSAPAVALGAGGATLIGGHFDAGGTFVLRLDASGVADATFAGDGRAELGSLLDRIDDLLVLADDRVLAAGYVQIGSDVHAAIVRLTADGALDPSFGSAGRLALPAAGVGMNALRLAALAQQPDGRIVAAGRADSGGTPHGLVLRTSADGVPDAGFGNGGLRVIDEVGGQHAFEALALQADGAIVLGGWHRAAPADESAFFAMRLLGGGGGGGLPTMSIADATLVEGDAGTSLMSFAISLSAPSDGSITVDIATDLGSATPGVDYQPTTATFVFPNGVDSAVFQVPVIGDTTTEPDETLLVRLSNPVGAVIADALANGTIVDDDAGVAPSGAYPAPVNGPFALLLLGVLLVLAAARQRRYTG